LVCPVCGTLRPGRLPASDASSLQLASTTPAPVTETKPTSTFVPKEPWPRKKNRDYTKLGGWILFWVISLSILSLFGLISNILTASSTSESSSIFWWMQFGVSVTISSLTLAAMILVVGRKAIFMPLLFFASAIRVVAIPLAFIKSTIPYFIKGDATDITLGVFSLFFGLCISYFYIVLLPWYFQHDERVCGYMRNDDYRTRYPWIETVLRKLVILPKAPEASVDREE